MVFIATTHEYEAGLYKKLIRKRRIVFLLDESRELFSRARFLRDSSKTT